MKIAINGANGRLGKSVIDCLIKNGYTDLIGVDISSNSYNSIVIYDDFSKINNKIDFLIDCSSIKALNNVLEYSLKNKIPLIICTTGYSEKQIDEIKIAGREIPILFSPNMSFGANLLFDIVEIVSKNTIDWDVEILETHHTNKLDKPSGTAVKLKEIVLKENSKVNVHSLRLSNVIGEHKVIFANNNESIIIEHKATNRNVFAEGVVKAITFLKNKNKGIYSLQDTLK